jgi:outer membrane biosynthesis protein TonB
MSRTKRFLTRWKGVAVALALLIPLLLGACGEPAAVPTEPPAPTEVSSAPSTPASAPTEPPTPTEEPTEPPPTDTPMPTDTPTPVPIDDTACVTCHTSEETLQALAEEEEEPEVESEGEG